MKDDERGKLFHNLGHPFKDSNIGVKLRDTGISISMRSYSALTGCPNF